MYLVTAAVTRIDIRLAPPLLEARNIAIHLTGYAVLGLLVTASTQTPLTRRDRLVILGAALALGLGQEVLQSILRSQIFLANSLFDLGVDTAGAWLGAWLFTRAARRRAAATT